MTRNPNAERPVGRPSSKAEAGALESIPASGEREPSSTVSSSPRSLFATRDDSPQAEVPPPARHPIMRMLVVDDADSWDDDVQAALQAAGLPRAAARAVGSAPGAWHVRVEERAHEVHHRHLPRPQAPDAAGDRSPRDEGQGEDPRASSARSVVVALDVTTCTSENRSRNEADARYRAFLEQCPDGIFVLGEGLRCRVVCANARLADVLGYPSVARLLGTPWTELYPEDEHAAALGRLAKLREGISLGPREVLLRSFDGGTVRVEAHAARLEVDGHNEIQVLVRDLRPRSRAEEALAQSEAYHRALVERGSDIAIVTNAEGIACYVSPTIATVLGWTPEDLVGHSTNETLHPDDASALQRACADIMGAPGASTVVELRRLHRDGSWRWVEQTLTNRLHDRAIAGVVVNLHDVSERHSALAARQASEARYRALAERAFDGAFILSKDDRFSYVSPSITVLFGYAPDALEGRRGNEFVHPEDLQNAQDTRKQAEHEPGVPKSIEARALHADGTWRWVELTYTSHLDHEAIQGVVVNIRDVTSRRKAEQQLAHQALHDPLTGLPNRALLEDRMSGALARATRTGETACIFMIDLDQFKWVNDAHGHEIGDRVLNEVSHRLAIAVRPGDTVARFAGDEFVVVCERLPIPGTLAHRLLQTLAVPIALGDGAGDVSITAAIGIAVTPVTDTATWLRHADLAMYRAKQRGRGSAELYDREIHDRVLRRYRLHESLQHAIADDELVVHYQPVVGIPDFAPSGVEALARWQHPREGLLLPADFIPAAEESHVVTQLGAWVLRRACREMASMTDANGEPSALTVAVNVSPRQLRPELPGLVSEVLHETGLDPQRLWLEVTETAVMADPDAALTVLHRLKDLGVHLSIDDFGTGYSSLSHLRRLPVDALKIDRTFVSGLGTAVGDSAIVAAVLSLARSVGATAVAEGVELSRQAEILRILGCPSAQGYLWSPPVPFARLLDVLERLSCVGATRS